LSGENAILPRLAPLQNIFGPPLEDPLLAPSWKKVFWRSFLGVYGHLSKCLTPWHVVGFGDFNLGMWLKSPPWHVVKIA